MNRLQLLKLILSRLQRLGGNNSARLVTIQLELYHIYLEVNSWYHPNFKNPYIVLGVYRTETSKALLKCIIQWFLEASKTDDNIDILLQELEATCNHLKQIGFFGADGKLDPRGDFKQHLIN